MEGFSYTYKILTIDGEKLIERDEIYNGQLWSQWIANEAVYRELLAACEDAETIEDEELGYGIGEINELKAILKKFHIETEDI